MSTIFDVNLLTNLHKECIARWQNNNIDFMYTEIYNLAEQNHAFNYQLWHAEDKARRDDLGPEFVYKAKREIDRFNQERNNRMEAMDAWFLKHLAPADTNICPVNSETPGMIIDRLSILSLKSHYMYLQTQRQDANAIHKTNCLQKFDIIKQQLFQLAHCLELLIEDVQAKTRTFRVYHQFKMYNDPATNPQLYLQEENYQVD